MQAAAAVPAPAAVAPSAVAPASTASMPLPQGLWSVPASHLPSAAAVPGAGRGVGLPVATFCVPAIPCHAGRGLVDGPAPACAATGVSCPSALASALPLPPFAGFAQPIITPLSFHQCVEPSLGSVSSPLPEMPPFASSISVIDTGIQTSQGQAVDPLCFAAPGTMACADVHSTRCAVPLFQPPPPFRAISIVDPGGAGTAAAPPPSPPPPSLRRGSTPSAPSTCSTAPT